MFYLFFLADDISLIFNIDIDPVLAPPQEDPVFPDQSAPGNHNLIPVFESNLQGIHTPMKGNTVKLLQQILYFFICTDSRMLYSL